MTRLLLCARPGKWWTGASYLECPLAGKVQLTSSCQSGYCVTQNLYLTMGTLDLGLCFSGKVEFSHSQKRVQVISGCQSGYCLTHNFLRRWLVGYFAV